MIRDDDTGCGQLRRRLGAGWNAHDVDTYRGESLLVINYRNQTGGLVNEVHIFDGDLVREGHGTYLD